ncbi:hypothetical protein VQ042_22100 [Aurantimonas sp. A2-1-M11]|uniref:hypothetical protein n=1 Tax=Aurantimonas sp. A2-1-M11 TaxID=3113712 RepID=UPI002F94CFA5
MALVVWFGLFDNYQLPVPRGIVDGDKIGHVAGFALVALAAGLLFGAGRRLSILLCIAAAVLECAQLAFPTRQFSVGDALASLVGTGLGLTAAIALAALVRWVNGGLAALRDGGTERRRKQP